MEERAWQGPYQKTLEQATEIVHLVIDSPSGIIFDMKGNQQYTDSTYAVPLTVCDTLEVKCYHMVETALLLARWMDALPVNIRYIRASRYYNKWVAQPVALYAMRDKAHERADKEGVAVFYEQ